MGTSGKKAYKIREQCSLDPRSASLTFIYRIKISSSRI